MLGMNKAIWRSLASRTAAPHIYTLHTLWKLLFLYVRTLFFGWGFKSVLYSYTLVFNQGAVMQPVQSSPLNMYTKTDNNNVLMPASKKITMQNQGPFGSLLWAMMHVVALISPYYTNFCYYTYFHVSFPFLLLRCFFITLDTLRFEVLKAFSFLLCRHTHFSDDRLSYFDVVKKMI